MCVPQLPTFPHGHVYILSSNKFMQGILEQGWIALLWVCASALYKLQSPAPSLSLYCLAPPAPPLSKEGLPVRIPHYHAVRLST